MKLLFFGKSQGKRGVDFLCRSMGSLPPDIPIRIRGIVIRIQIPEPCFTTIVQIAAHLQDLPASAFA
jgi:hypothetical protein